MNGEDVKLLGRKLDGLKDGQAGMDAKLAGLTAEVITTNKQHRNELDLLFATAREHEGRINAVERDYVPDDEFKGCQKRSQREHREHRNEIRTLQVGWARVLGGAAVAAVLVGIIVAAVMKMTT